MLTVGKPATELVFVSNRQAGLQTDQKKQFLKKLQTLGFLKGLVKVFCWGVLKQIDLPKKSFGER